MADSVYISKNLSRSQLEFIQMMEAYEILYFDMNSIEDQLHHSFENLNEILENLVDKELLVRVERGKYAKSNYHNIPTLATFISRDGVLGYWSALHHHGLTSRFPNKVFVKTTFRKRDTVVLDTPVQFIVVKKGKDIGTIKVGHGDESFSVTDVEMTLVDCFDQPRYAGDFADLIKGFSEASLTNNKLITYTRVYHNIALTKRMGYLAELFHSESLKSFIRFAKEEVNNRYSLMDAGGSEQGEFVNEWKLRLNVSKETLLNMAENPY